MRLTNFIADLIDDDHLNKDETKQKIINMTTPSYPFSAFNWWVINEDPVLKADLGL